MPDFVPSASLATPVTESLPSETGAILRVLGKNTLWLWLDLGALRVGTMLAGLLLIRYFGPTNFGIYSTALAAGWLTNAVIDLGLTRYAARAVAATPSEGPPILALSLLTTGASLCIQIAVLILSAMTGHWSLACIAAGLVLSNFEGTASLCSSILTADLRARAILSGSVIGAVGLISLVFLVIWLHLSVFVMLLGLCFKSFLVFGMRLWQLRSYWPSRRDYRWSAFLAVAKRAWPYFSYNVTQVGYGRVAIVCLGLVASQDKVGWFAAAFVVSDVFPQWSYASTGALLPVWTRLFESKRIVELLSLRQRLLDIVMFASVPLWVGLAVFAPEICNFLGPRFASSALVLRIIAYRSVLSVLDGFLGHGFLIAVNRVQERQGALARCFVVLTVLSLSFGYFWGPVGIAFALFIADAMLIVQYLQITSRIGLKIDWPALMPSLVSGAAMALCIFDLAPQTTLLFKVLTAFTTYFTVLILLSRGRVLNAGRTLRECAGGG